MIFHQNPLALDLVLNLPSDGIRLVFDPVSQRLKVFCFCHLTQEIILIFFFCYFYIYVVYPFISLFTLMTIGLAK